MKKVERCPKCREKLTLTNRFECPKCKQVVCLKHRFEEDHDCVPQVGACRRNSLVVVFTRDPMQIVSIDLFTLSRVFFFTPDFMRNLVKKASVGCVGESRQILPILMWIDHFHAIRFHPRPATWSKTGAVCPRAIYVCLFSLFPFLSEVYYKH